MGIVYSPALDNCILQQQSIGEMQAQRRSAARRQLSAALLNPPSPVIVRNPTVNCVTRQSYGNVYTTCR